jgi:hypothetical protein
MLVPSGHLSFINNLDPANTPNADNGHTIYSQRLGCTVQRGSKHMPLHVLTRHGGGWAYERVVSDHTGRWAEILPARRVFGFWILHAAHSY